MEVSAEAQDLITVLRQATDGQHRYGVMILRDSRLTRHPSCLTSGVHLIAG